MDFDGERMVCFGGRPLGGPIDRVAEAEAAGDGMVDVESEQLSNAVVLLPSAADLESLIYFGTALTLHCTALTEIKISAKSYQSSKNTFRFRMLCEHPISNSLVLNRHPGSTEE
jgi:hypothetical protein